MEPPPPALYSLHIEASPSAHTPDQPDAASSSSRSMSSSKDIAASIKFTAGNPRVEHITGLVHLYRPAAVLPQPLEPTASNANSSGLSEALAAVSIHGGSSSAGGAATGTSSVSRDSSAAGKDGILSASSSQRSSDRLDVAASGSSAGLPEAMPTSPVLCCLAIPADMALSDFCSFVGAYLRHVPEMRVLRRESRQRVVCMVLLRFDAQEHADSFYADFNGKPFSSLEPEILCRLVYVSDVEVSTPRSRSSGGHATCAFGTSALSISPANPSYAAALGSTSAMLLLSAPTSSTLEAGTSAAAGAGAAGGVALAAASTSGEIVAAGHGSGSKGCSGTVAMLEPPPGQLELPTCPVCLERLDEHISGIVTTVCNHQFHSECLRKWGDTSCPVCRYCTHASANTSRCGVCGTQMDLWICLICGHVGCGRYRAGHAIDHWKGSHHCYALELETQRVWDYFGDGYVHRLIQSKTDGKLVEVPSPAPNSATGRQASTGNPFERNSCGEEGRSGSLSHSHAAHHHQDQWQPDEEGGSDGGMKEAIMASKLDAIASEYNHLLSSQLDSQRQYFEGLLSQCMLDADHRCAQAGAAADAAMEAAAVAASSASDVNRARQALERKLADALSSLKAANKEREFLTNVNEGLVSNQKELQSTLEVARAESAAKDALITDLQEQVRDLMMYLEAQRVIGGSEAEGATLLPVPQQEGKGRGRKSSGKGSKR